MAGFLGIGSGITSIDSLIAATLNAESAPKTKQLQTLETKTTAQFDALNTLRSAVGSFQTALSNLNKVSLYEARTASLSTSGFLTANATSTAPVGNYAIQVQQLAVGSKVALKSFNEPAAGSTAAATTFSSGKVTIFSGDPADPATKKLELDISGDASTSTQAGIRDAINAQGASQGFSASLVTDASGTRLVISSSSMGDGNDIRVEVSDQGPVGSEQVDLAELAFTPTRTDVDDEDSAFVAPDSSVGGGAAGVIAQARSARLTVDGLQVVHDSNTIDKAIEGVTLNLTKADEAQTINLTVGTDKSKVSTSLQQFVTAYNALTTTVDSLGAVVRLGEGVKPSTGPLVGDASLRSLQSGLRAELSRMQSGDGINALAQMGITTQKDGTLALDSSKLDKVLNENFEHVAGYLTGGQGLMGRMDKVVAGFTKTDGVLDQRQASLRKTLNSVDEQRKALDTRMSKMKDRLVAQYTAMDQLVAKLNNTGDWLGSQLSNLPGVVKSTK